MQNIVNALLNRATIAISLSSVQIERIGRGESILRQALAHIIFGITGEDDD